MARPVPAFTLEEARGVLETLPRLDGVHLDGARIDDRFLAQVRIAYHWATTCPGRWGVLTKRTFYTSRNFCEIDTRSTMGDAAFAVGSALAGWLPAIRYDDYSRPWTGMKRA